MAYNGWTNYETWAVKLWIDNDEGTYTYWRERTRECWNEAADESPNKFMDRGGNARMLLAAALQNDHDSQSEHPVFAAADGTGQTQEAVRPCWIRTLWARPPPKNPPNKKGGTRSRPRRQP